MKKAMVAEPEEPDVQPQVEEIKVEQVPAEEEKKEEEKKEEEPALIRRVEHRALSRLEFMKEAVQK